MTSYPFKSTKQVFRTSTSKKKKTAKNYPDNCSHVDGLSDCSKTSGVSTDDENFSRWNLSGGRRLAREEPAEVVGCLHNSSAITTHNYQLFRLFPTQVKKLSNQSNDVPVASDISHG